LFSPQNGALETRQSALALQRNEDELLSVGLIETKKIALVMFLFQSLGHFRIEIMTSGSVIIS
jgi:hypothetical protein